MSSSLQTGEFAIRNFLNYQENLDVMTYLASGHSFRQIGQMIGKKHSFVQNKSDFLKKSGLMSFGRWNIDVNALGMRKTFEFYEYREEIKNEILSNEYKNFYLSYLSEVTMGEMRYFAMYTFPEEVKANIGSGISSWYYMFPHLTNPLFGKGDFERQFETIFEEEDNGNSLPPRGKRIRGSGLIDMYICRYVQLELDDINLKRYTKKMKEEIGDLVDVHYSTVRSRFKKLKAMNVIYPVNPLNFTNVSYDTVFFVTSYEDIFRFMKTLAKLNIIVAVSFMDSGKSILYIQCPYVKRNGIARILGTLDRKSQMFSITNMYVNRGLPYKYYLKKYKS